jgi:hypothetical protein
MPDAMLSDSHRDDAVVTEWAVDPADWDDFVQAHPWGTVYHLTAWRRVLQKAFPHIEGRFLLLRSSADGRLLGGLPLYTVKSWLLGNRLVSIPFASFCDPLVPDSGLLARLVDEAWRFAGLRKLSSLEIRLFRAGTLAEEAGLAPALYSRHHFTDLKKPVEKLWDSFSKTSVKQQVQRAEKAGIQISSGPDDEALAVFAHMLSDNRQRHSLPNLPFRFFEAMKRELGPDRLSCWLARDQNGKPLAGLIGWRLGDRFAVEYAGDFVEARDVGANQLLYWCVMQAARSIGCGSFSFGRTGLDNEGLRRYKLHWGTIEEDLSMILLPKAHAEVIEQEPLSYRLAKGLIAHSPRALFKLIGEFCYRHLG